MVGVEELDKDGDAVNVCELDSLSEDELEPVITWECDGEVVFPEFVGVTMPLLVPEALSVSDTVGVLL